MLVGRRRISRCSIKQRPDESACTRVAGCAATKQMSGKRRPRRHISFLSGMQLLLKEISGSGRSCASLIHSISGRIQMDPFEFPVAE